MEQAERGGGIRKKLTYRLYGEKEVRMINKLLIAVCYLEMFLLIASVILLIVEAMVMIEQDKRNNAKKGGEQP